MNYNVWHIELYHGWYDYDGPEDCNVKDDFVFDARFTKEQVMEMMVSLYEDDRCVEIAKCNLIND